MRQWQTLTPAKATVCANHNSFLALPVLNGELAVIGGRNSTAVRPMTETGVIGEFYG